MLVWNILLAISWCWLMGNFSAANIIGGFLLGFVVLAALSRREIIRGRGYALQVPRVLALIVYFIWELIIANLRLAYDLLTPGTDIEPRIIAMPLSAKTDAAITVVASLITLTPGTLSVDVSKDKKTLYIHAMYAKDEAALIKELKNGFERRVLEVLPQ